MNEKYEELEEGQRQLIAEADVLEAKVKAFAAKLKNMTGPDQRNVALGLTHSEDAFMRFRRSIATGQQNPGHYHAKEQN